MLRTLSILIGFQLIGEALVALFGLPIPGPVVGMLALFTVLVMRGRVTAGFAQDVDAVLAYLPLILIPPSVGIMDHWDRLAGDGTAIAVTLLLTTAGSLALAALLMHVLARHR